MTRRAQADHQTRLSAPAVRLRDVDPGSGNDLPDGVCKAFYVGGTGDVEVVAELDTSPRILKAVPVGALMPIRVKQFLAGGTTATFIIALY